MYGRRVASHPEINRSTAIVQCLRGFPNNSLEQAALRERFTPSEITAAVECGFIYPQTIGATAYYTAN